MAYMHRSPANRNPLTEVEAARLEVLASKKKRTAWETGEAHSLLMRAPSETRDRLRPVLAAKSPGRAS